MSKKIFIFANESETSKRTEKKLKQKLDNSGFTVLPNYCEDADLLVCIGGDGTFLEAIHKFGFPAMPIIGINTGHLGFFQEIRPSLLDDFIFNYTQGRYSIQKLSTVSVKVACEDNKTFEHVGLNEVIIKGNSTYSIHLNISIGGSFIERFSGDGLLIATPSGSTAYNYSLGGSIVDPRLKLLQVTPIAPMNTTAYRSFTSSILLPSDLSLGVVPDMNDIREICVVYDGYSANYENIKEIEVSFCDTTVSLMRFENYDFWTKVKSKFL